MLATPLEQFHNASSAERQRGLNLLRDIFPVSMKTNGLKNDAFIAASPSSHDFEHIIAPTLAISFG